jgi:hypothetical protein
VADGSPSTNCALKQANTSNRSSENQQVSWFDKMRKADVAPEVANNLPELNVEWY